jgi:hypothetical protein
MEGEDMKLRDFIEKVLDEDRKEWFWWMLLTLILLGIIT